MIRKITNDQKIGNSHIAILYPGRFLGSQDSGIGSVGRIDQAEISFGTTIKMHPHVNDEILSYFRVGTVIHTDSGGFTETIGRKKLMLMKAGTHFEHEEKIVDRLEGLQIFIRPKAADDIPSVSFMDLEPMDSRNTWRLLASNSDKSELIFTSETEVHDLKITRNDTFALPKTFIENATFLLYVFLGKVKVSGGITLEKGESMVTDEFDTVFSGDLDSEIVVLITNPRQECFTKGMFSGNMFNAYKG